MTPLKVRGLCKNYPAFSLRDVSFQVEEGRICGFIGRNGAGKSTTLSSLLGLVHPDAGEAVFFGMRMAENQQQIKQRIGFVGSGVNYYPRRKLRAITAVTRMFYESWDETAYRQYLQRFALDENKTPAQLSAGMKVKYALALALSHRAELLILDEPTSGLDPVSRDELLDVFLQLCREGKSILFSTHITSDLDKCADDIVYIRNGRIAAQDTLKGFTGGWRLASFETIPESQRALLAGVKQNKHDYSALVRAEDAPRLSLPCRETTLEEIMVHLEKEGAAC